MLTDDETALKEARRATARRAALIVGITLACLASVLFAVVWYASPSDEAETARETVQQFFVRDGLRRTE